MRRIFFAPLLIAPCLLWPRAAAASDAAPVATQAEFFEAKVRPILAARCLDCHGAEKQDGKLRLDSRSALLAGGDSGPAIVLGHPELSRLVQSLRHDGALKMPPAGRLPEDEIAVLTKWVGQGAPWPDSGSASSPPRRAAGRAISEADRGFWSFRPVRDPAPPPVHDTSWPRSAIDRFILSELESHGLRPVPAADRRTLIRRATFDLVGLPPSPEEVEAFVADASPDAFARVVDRLLASPHYGERWARHWLDIARYGEDQAHTFQARKYPEGYRYRDWLVQAFNEDLPYDRFIVDQIAGDLVAGPDRTDRLPALGFFALGPVYYGDPKKLDQIDDRIDTLTRGFLGLTVACARCHDHKYDPIPTEDYYALAGVFASTEYAEAPVAPTDVVEAYRRAAAPADALAKRIDQRVDAETAGVARALACDETARYMVAAWKLETRRKTSAGTTAAQLAKEEGLRDFLLDAWVRYLAAPAAAKRPALARWSAVIERQDAASDLSGDAPAAGEVHAAGEVREAAEAFQKYVRALVRLRDAIDEHRAATAANAAGAATASAGPALAEPDAQLLDELVGPKGVFSVPKNRAEELMPARARAELAGMRSELEEVKKKLPPKYPVAHALADAARPLNMRVHIRGNPDTLGDEVPRHFLSVLSAGTPHAFVQGSGRLDLARAIAGRDNPLTARVMVNRIWQHHFGHGLARTASNFGALGERPTHPELLDHLASRFMASGWSIKTMHRAIMLSATYQSASRTDPQNQEADPENRLLWRMNRRRLEVEVWRDGMLAVSGTLERTIGGPSLDLAAPQNRRRTLYAAISRHDLDGLLRLFDFPDPNITSAERTVTTVPLQQLFVLNSEFMVANARALAARLTAQAGEDDRARIARAIPLLYARPATERDIELGLQFLARAAADATATAGSPPLLPWEQYAQVLLGANEFLYVD